MTVPCFFTSERSAASILLQRDTKPTLRGTGFFQTTTGTTIAVTWPSGTVAGDLAVVSIIHDYAGSAPAGWSTAYTTGTSNTTGIDASVYYKVLTAADITAGGQAFTRGTSFAGRAGVATFQDGANLVVSLMGSNKTTGTDASFAFPYASLQNATFLVMGGHWSTGAVTFSGATILNSTTADTRSCSFGIYNPASDATRTETVSFASSSNPIAFLIGVTKGTLGGENVATSTAISSAAEGTRWVTGPTYFEMVATAVTGVVGVGLASFTFGHGAAALGTGLLNLVYNSNGQVRFNNTTLTTISNFTTGDRISVAYHPALQLIWFKVNAGSWNNDGSADPATFVNGIDVSGFSGGQASPACSFSVVGGSVKGFFSAASFNYTPPTGYYSIEEVVVTAAHNPMERLAPVITEAAVTDACYMAIDPEQSQTAYISFPAGPIKLIAGEVRENDVGVPGRVVRIYNRLSGDLLGSAVTNSVGEFSIPAKDPNLEHYVVALDDDAGTVYNAKIYDRVLPG